jgi:hypothetical protein
VGVLTVCKKGRRRGRFGSSGGELCCQSFDACWCSTPAREEFRWSGDCVWSGMIEVLGYFL